MDPSKPHESSSPDQMDQFVSVEQAAIYIGKITKVMLKALEKDAPINELDSKEIQVFTDKTEPTKMGKQSSISEKYERSRKDIRRQWKRY